ASSDTQIDVWRRGDRNRGRFRTVREGPVWRRGPRGSDFDWRRDLAPHAGARFNFRSRPEPVAVLVCDVANSVLLLEVPDREIDHHLRPSRLWLNCDRFNLEPRPAQITGNGRGTRRLESEDRREAADYGCPL